MSALAATLDPYLMPMPGPDSPVVLQKWISSANAHPNSRLRDLVWSLAPLIDGPAHQLSVIDWTRCPEPLREQAMLAAWTMINGERRPSYVRTRGTSTRGRMSAHSMKDACAEWIRLARFLHARGVATFAACTDQVWRAYAAQRCRSGNSRHRGERILSFLSDLWVFDQISARPSGITEPPWEREGVDDFLPAASTTAGAENSTEPLDPKVLGPLLVWALLMVEDLAEDILAAWAEKRRLTDVAAGNPATADGLAALHGYLLPLIQADAPLPSLNNQGTKTLARTYIAATVGASLGQISHFRNTHKLAEQVNRRPGPCPLQVPILGRVNGRPWCEYLDFGEAPVLMRHLGTAAAIVCLYLTGMRPQEVLGLRSGCCPDPEPLADGSPGRHLIRAHHYKNVVDDEGNHISAGELRAVPWVAIAPVVRAIRVLERMVPEGALLFDLAHHDFGYGYRAGHGSLRDGGMRARIEDFVAWANRKALALDLPEQAIPEDPHGRIGMARFRRTLAWHIARRPGGLIALAIQYGHMRTALDARTSTGYASRARDGMHSVLDVETALAAADTAARLRERLAAGEKISGPAARRALTAAQAPRFEGRLVKKNFAKQAAAYLARDGLVLYDNPEACLICVFKRDTALCEPGPDATAPNQYDCRPGCGNAVRLDGHARDLRSRARDTNQLAEHAPDPVAKRMRAAADRQVALADAHDDTALPAEALT